MGLFEFYQSLPSIESITPYQFYIKGYTEALKQFSDVRVVLSEEWLQGVPLDLRDYFYRVGFPNYFIPIFLQEDCFGFVLKGFSKETPRFGTNMLLPGCERIMPGGLVLLVEGIKDTYLPLQACRGLPVTVLPMLTAVPGRELLAWFKEHNCAVLYVPDNDDRRADHVSRFAEVCGKVGIRNSLFLLEQVGDFGEFFETTKRIAVLEEGKRLRKLVQSLVTF